MKLKRAYASAEISKVFGLFGLMGGKGESPISLPCGVLLR